MKTRKPHALGFTLVEIIVALAIVAAGASGTLMYQARARAVDDARATATAIDSMMSALQERYKNQPIHQRYMGLTVAQVAGLGLVAPPLRWDGTNIVDPFGNAITVVGRTGGAPPWLGITIGGSNYMNPEVCVAIATYFTHRAARIFVGSGAFTPVITAPWPGYANGGYFYKSPPAALNAAGMRTGCDSGGTAQVIAMSYL